MRISLFIAVLSVCFGTFAQRPTATLDHPKMLIGEPVKYTLKVELPKRTSISYDAYMNAIPAHYKQDSSNLPSAQKFDLEILTGFTDTLLEGKTKDTWIGEYTITAWDSGSFVLPEPMIVLADSMFYFPATYLRCDLLPAIKGQGLYDIHESFADVPDPQTWVDILIRNLWWILILLGIGAFIFIQFNRHKKATKDVKKSDKGISLKERTILAIDALDQQKLYLNGQLKQHYVELSFIMRSYLSARYNLNLLEKTTIETRLLLRNEGLHPETIDTLMTILFQSDMVKFAKSEPDEMSILKVSILAKQIVAETSPIEFESVE